MQNQQFVNGINVTQLSDTIAAITEQPTLAKFEFRAQNKWLGGARNQSQIKDFYGAGQEDASRAQAFVLGSDEPPVLLGENSSASPVEFVLHALAACLTSAIVYHAAARGIRINAIESTLTGDLDAQGVLDLSQDVPKGFENITVNFRIESDASAEELEQLARFSPVLDIVSTPTNVKLNIETREPAAATA